MKLHSQSSGSHYPEQIQKTEIKVSRAEVNSSRYASEKQIQKLEQKNIIEGYFKLFDESHTEIEIKNLIAARLQPSYQLPQVHDTKILSQKAAELLNFSLSI